MWFYSQELIKASYHSVKFVGHNHCVSGDIMILVCYVMFT